MAVTATETERKYETSADGSLPDLGTAPAVAGVEPADTEELDAVYYDTPDLRLLSRRITLRRRQGGHDEGWHLKLPAGPDSRREVRLPLDAGGPSQVPQEPADLVRAVTRGRELVPVAHLRTRRTRQVLRDAEGNALAEVADDRVTAQVLGSRRRAGDEAPGQWTEITSWHEVEVELETGGPDLLEAVEQILIAAGLRRSGSGSKLARVLAEEPSTVGPRPQQSLRTAGGAVLARVSGQADAILAWDPAVRLDEPDSVHQMRVATRRLRSALKTYRKILDRRATDPVEAELKWLAEVLGRARDSEVLGQRLSAEIDRLPVEVVLGPVEARITARTASEYRDAHRAALEALSGDRYFALLDALDRLLADPPLLPAAEQRADRALDKAARREHRRLAGRVEAALEAEPGQDRDAALHSARKAAKRARYAGETAQPVLGGRAKRFTKRMKKVQQLLGIHQDAVVTRSELRTLGIRAHGAGENAFTYGLLWREQTAAADDVERRLPELWRRVGRPKYARLRR
ncbi:CYTH and CHAD domain-containing protein [Wenjunlia tyrosinilytica]|uniref:CHAD domain-containing protein n=1 Tax=Wenjunlia tyrosinilytica TaxID=1544741 RepID=A0A918DXZ9_9ACTN|nr:CYTH and CHAD domain-containing protein [Wenjunlia tyrosinilytica]GGO87712.1 CHAD domain-containing protein [Wenjunlia tyrosinilytica]